MNPYKGIITIKCMRKKGGCLRNLNIDDVQPGCMDCPKALTQILDLDDKVIFEYRSPEIKTGKRTRRLNSEILNRKP